MSKRLGELNQKFENIKEYKKKIEAKCHSQYLKCKYFFVGVIFIVKYT